MRKNSKNNFGFTLAELAATLGVFALAATILTPAFSGVSAISNSNVMISNEAPAGASPFTPPVSAILVDVTNSATGVSTQKVVTDPNATSTTISGLDPQATYTVEVAKQNQAGKSPAAVATVEYIKTGEVQVERTGQRTVEDRNNPISWESVVVGYQQKTVGYQQKLSGYQQKTISVAAKSEVHKGYTIESVAKTREVRIAPFERDVRIAPFTRSVRVAPYERTTYVPASSYSYSCTKYRTVHSRCGNTSYACGTESYTYSCTKTRAKTCYRNRNYSYNCGTAKKPKTCTATEREPYQCGTESYSSTCSGTRTKYCSEPKYCASEESYTATCTGTTPARYDTVTLYNYADEAVYNYRSEAVYNYRTETYYEDVAVWHTSNLGVSEGACTYTTMNVAGTNGGLTCTNTTMSKTVNDTTKPIYVDDTSKPIRVDDTTKPIMGNGQPNAWGTKQESYNYSVTQDTFGGETTRRSVKANAGQLLLNPATVQTVKGVWKSATVDAKGAGTSQTVGSRVNFTRAKLVTLNGAQYLVVDARAAR